MRTWLDATAPPVQRRALPIVAVLLALLVFAPGVSLVGSWASPTPVNVLGTSSDHSAIAPAQLILPAARPVTALAQVLLLIFVAARLCDQRWRVPATGPHRGEPIPRSGRRGRTLLHAFLN